MTRKPTTELANLSNADLRRLDGHLKAEVKRGQRLRVEIGRERKRRRQDRKRRAD